MFLNSLLSGEWTWYFANFTSAMNTARTIALWATIVLAAAFVILVVALKDEKRKKFLKISLIVAIVYACGLGILFLTLTFLDDGVNAITFVPTLILLVVIAASAVVLAFKRSKPVIITLACLIGAALVATLVCMGVYYFNDIANDGYYNSDTAEVKEVALYVSAAALLVVAVGGALLLGKNDKSGFDTRCIALAAICIAMSFALSYVRFVKMPQGGSVTLASLLPLMIFTYIYGPKKGVAVGFVYGILQAIQDPWIIHPAQFLLDYPIAYAMIGFTGIFANVKRIPLPQVRFALGAIVAGVLRFVSHVLSGVFAFKAYAGDTNVWLYSLGYNSFVFLDILIVLVAGIFVFSSKAFVRQVETYALHDRQTE